MNRNMSNRETDNHELFVEAFIYILLIQEKMVEERDTLW